MLLDRCPVCLSVTLVYCGQTVGWIKTKLGTEVGFGPRPHCDRRGPSSPQKGTAPQFSAHVCCGQTAGRIKMPLGMEIPRPRRHCVRWGPSSTPKKGAQQPLHNFWPTYCGQTGEWIKMPLGMEVGLSPGDIILDGDSAHP